MRAGSCKDLSSVRPRVQPCSPILWVLWRYIERVAAESDGLYRAINRCSCPGALYPGASSGPHPRRTGGDGKRGQSAGERKTITALFADMAGSTALIQDLDPEEARSLIDPVVALMMEAVHHYEGYVAKSLGDGIMALFGAPIAHEDHALRALFAALRMQQAMRSHSDRVRLEQGIPLQIRVGVHTGEVVVRSIRKDDLRADYDPVGHTIHIAARMEGVATPSSILVSESTHKLAEGYFEFRPWGGHRLRACASRWRSMRWSDWAPYARACKLARTGASPDSSVARPNWSASAKRWNWPKRGMGKSWACWRGRCGQIAPLP